MPLATEDLIRLRLRHLGVVDAVTGERIKPARKGDVFGSEARPHRRPSSTSTPPAASRGEGIDDFTGEWHESDDNRAADQVAIHVLSNWSSQ
jgi:hypothetical protein